MKTREKIRVREEAFEKVRKERKGKLSLLPFVREPGLRGQWIDGRDYSHCWKPLPFSSVVGRASWAQTALIDRVKPPAELALIVVTELTRDAQQNAKIFSHPPLSTHQPLSAASAKTATWSGDEMGISAEWNKHIPLQCDVRITWPGTRETSFLFFFFWTPLRYKWMYDWNARRVRPLHTACCYLSLWYQPEKQNCNHKQDDETCLWMMGINSNLQ